MKIKVLPDDFIVREIMRLPMKKDGAHYVYELEKINWNTMDALSQIAKLNNLRLADIGYGGKKDRYAHTYQHISALGAPLGNDTGNPNLILRFLGRTTEAIAPKQIDGNRFSIVLRNLEKDEPPQLIQRLKEIGEYGFANYFGEQRFGSYDKEQGFFAEKFVKAHYNGAVKCLFCSIHPEDKKEEKERKRQFIEHWGDFKACLRLAKTSLEKKAFGILAQRPKAFLDVVHIYPPHEISMAFSAYQSYLWNSLLALLIEKRVKERGVIAIKEWSLPAYRTLDAKELAFLSDLRIPMHGIRPVFTDDHVEKLYQEVLQKEELHQGRFNLRHYRKVIIKSFPREAIVIPQDVTIGTEEADERYAWKHKLSIGFVLPRGSFATTLLKHLEMC